MLLEAFDSESIASQARPGMSLRVPSINSGLFNALDKTSNTFRGARILHLSIHSEIVLKAGEMNQR